MTLSKTQDCLIWNISKLIFITIVFFNDVLVNFFVTTKHVVNTFYSVDCDCAQRAIVAFGFCPLWRCL